jgi:hypothetical protein
LTIPGDEGTPQDPQGATEEPLGPPFPPVSSFTVVFEEPGVYPYFCAIHPWMLGQVIVRGDAQTETGITQPSANETATTTLNQTAPETQDMPLPEPDAETQTPSPPTTGTESPNPIFG